MACTICAQSISWTWCSIRFIYYEVMSYHVVCIFGYCGRIFSSSIELASISLSAAQNRIRPDHHFIHALSLAVEQWIDWYLLLCLDALSLPCVGLLGCPLAKTSSGHHWPPLSVPGIVAVRVWRVYHQPGVLFSEAFWAFSNWPL